MGPRSIYMRHGKRQNFKADAAAWRLTLGMFIPLNSFLTSQKSGFKPIR